MVADAKTTSAADPGTPSLPTAGCAARLQEENEQLKQALQSRPVIDLARGVLMASFGCSAEDAWKILLFVSQNSNTKLRCVATTVAKATEQHASLPPHLQRQIAAAVEALRADGGETNAQDGINLAP